MVWLVVFVFRVRLGQKDKSNEKFIYFENINERLKKEIKQVQNTKNQPKLFLKSFKIVPNRNPKKVRKTKIGP
jgi:hypothetical protein